MLTSPLRPRWLRAVAAEGFAVCVERGQFAWDLIETADEVARPEPRIPVRREDMPPPAPGLHTCIRTGIGPSASAEQLVPTYLERSRLFGGHVLQRTQLHPFRHH